MTARTRVTTLALAVSIALGHASVALAANQQTKADSYSKRAIIGGDARANAIIGGDRQKSGRAIIGGDNRSDAIIGGDARANAIIGGDIEAMLASGIVAQGPIESLDPTKSLVVVLGQTFRFGGTAEQMKLLRDRIAAGEAIIAAVNGAVDGTGAIRVKAMSLSGRQYVPGSTSVMIVGKVQSVDASRGSMTVGKLQVDYSAALAAGVIQLTPGQLVAIVGVQSASDMPLIVYSIKPL